VVFKFKPAGKFGDTEKLEKALAVVPEGAKVGEIVIVWFSVPVYGLPGYWKVGGTAVTASVIVVDTDPVAFVAVTVKLVCANNTVGVPEIIPVLGFIVKLAGSVGVIVIVTGVPVIVGIQLLIA
jgi:hypothetical protein